MLHNELRDVPGPLGDWARNYPHTGTTRCLQAPNNVPNKLREKTGLEVADWSCTAQTSGSMLDRLESAIQAGDVRNDTTVIMPIGMNDYGPFGMTENKTLGIFSPDAVRSTYIANLHKAADRVRSVAPEARLMVVGALPTVDRDSAVFCSLNVIPNMPLGVAVPALRDAENWNRDNQIQAAAEIGATFVDIMPGARGHDTCAKDTERWVAGVIDTTTPDYNMWFHPSDPGSNYVADQIVAAL